MLSEVKQMMICRNISSVTVIFTDFIWIPTVIYGLTKGGYKILHMCRGQGGGRGPRWGISYNKTSSFSPPNFRRGEFRQNVYHKTKNVYNHNSYLLTLMKLQFLDDNNQKAKVLEKSHSAIAQCVYVYLVKHYCCFSRVFLKKNDLFHSEQIVSYYKILQFCLISTPSKL